MSTNCGFVIGANGNIQARARLEGLADNGGPTQTHALSDGIPAIDAGVTALTTDQRGFARPFGAEDDIGAFEEARLGKITVVKQTREPTTTDLDFTKEWTGACADVGSNAQCYLPKIVEDKTSRVAFESSDIDNDGVPNGSDKCPNTPSGAVVDQNGCAIEQLCLCDQAGNHGQYVSCVAHAANAFVRAGLIGASEKGAIMVQAAQSQRGK